MSLSFAIIGPKKSQNTRDLCDAINTTDNICSLYNINDLSFCSKSLNENAFLKHDIYIFRAYNKSIMYAHILSSLLLANGKIVIDDLLTKTVVRNKFEETVLLSSKNIPHPQTLYAQNSFAWNRLLQKFKYPIIVKSLTGQKGQDLYKFNSHAEAKSFFAKNPKGFLAQEYIASDGDVRVFIVGNNVLGAIKRRTISGDFRSNTSLGAQSEVFVLSESVKNIALCAHKVIGYDISGVDIIFDKDDNPFVLEVNHTPQWQAFKKTTGINPAEEIIHYSIRKYEEKNRIL